MTRIRRGRRDRTSFKDFVIFVLAITVIIQSYLLIKKPDEPAPVAYVESEEEVESVPEQVVEAPKPKPKPKSKPQPIAKPAPKPLGSAGKIVLIIDDWGYSTRNCATLNQIKAPITVAILPELTHTNDVINCAAKANKEIILHLPLEPHQLNGDEYEPNYLINTEMSSKMVRRRLNEILNSMPQVVGVNNHMGSKATENERLMGLVFKELKKRDLFFVDSLVTADSVVSEKAKEWGIDHTKRDVFLDNENNRRYIENQFAQLAQKARDKGIAIGIGHDRELTMQIVKEQVIRLQYQGFEFITVQNVLSRTN